MTAQQTLRAALEDYSRFLEEAGYLDSDWRAEPPATVHRFMATHAAKHVEAMEQHRREGMEEVEAWFNNFINTSSPDDPFDTLMEELPKFLTALKTNTSG